LKPKPAQCRCGALIYLVEESGLRWTADMTPLDRQGAITRLMGGGEVYVLDGKRLTLANPTLLAQPGVTVVGSHPCPPGAARALEKAAPAPSPQPTPPGPPVSRTAPSLGSQGGPSSVPGAVKPPTRPCTDCGAMMAEGEYVAVELADVVVWAAHLDRCP